MLRRMILGAVTATGLVSGFAAMPAAAEARPPVVVHYEHHGRRNFEVLYRRGACWEVYGNFRERCDADAAAHRLESRGFAVEIRRVAC
jgi:hypothetical protein